MTTDLKFLDNDVHVHITSAQIGGTLAVLESTAPRGDQTPLHVHHHDDEAFYVLEGEVTLWAGDETHVLRAG